VRVRLFQEYVCPSQMESVWKEVTTESTCRSSVAMESQPVSTLVRVAV
jgi:hypothetical protein